MKSSKLIRSFLSRLFRGLTGRYSNVVYAGIAATLLSQCHVSADPFINPLPVPSSPQPELVYPSPYFRTIPGMPTIHRRFFWPEFLDHAPDRSRSPFMWPARSAEQIPCRPTPGESRRERQTKPPAAPCLPAISVPPPPAGSPSIDIPNQPPREIPPPPPLPVDEPESASNRSEGASSLYELKETSAIFSPVLAPTDKTTAASYAPPQRDRQRCPLQVMTKIIPRRN